jgi:undecaprenyl diphosphate synthase
MDGNGRWATLHGKPRIEGHQAGALSVRRVVEASRKLGVSYLTLYAFSTENWLRPDAEVTALMGLFAQHLQSELPLFLEHDIRLRVIGDTSRLSCEIQQMINEVQISTEHCAALHLTLAISYGGRSEILRATQEFARGVQDGRWVTEELNEALFQTLLYCPEIPDPDLLIRTSGEYRVSNFLLWQIAYTELVVTDVLWPDFGETDLTGAILEFQTRARRFGLTSEQVTSTGEGHEQRIPQPV